MRGDNKVAVFLTVVRYKCYGLLESLLAPAKPKERTCDELVAALRDTINQTLGNHSAAVTRGCRSETSVFFLSEYYALLKEELGTIIPHNMQLRVKESAKEK